MRRLFLTLGIAGVLGLALPATPGAGASTGATVKTEEVMQLTGKNSPNQTDQWDVCGTDLGHMFLYGDEVRYTFGDTFGCVDENHRDNTMAWGADKTVTDGLKFDSYVTDAGKAKKLFDDPNVASVIPTNGIAHVDSTHPERIFLHYMAVREWLSPGRWDVAYSGIAYSDDGGDTWTMDPDTKWGDRSNFAQVAFLRGSDGPLEGADRNYIYLFGIKEGRFGGVKLARVPDTIDAPLEPNNYEYWTGSGWAKGEKNAKTIVPAPVGELSVRWNAHYQKWFMTYLNDNNLPGEPERIVLRYADKDNNSFPGFIGSWSDELTLTTSNEYTSPYAPYQVPTQPASRVLYYNMSQFFPIYNVFLMKTELPDPLPSSSSTQLTRGVDKNVRRLLP